MEIINSLQNINEKLNLLINNDEYTSIGYIPTLNSITSSDIVAIKKAKKLLDIIIVQNISYDSFSEFSLQALNKISPDLIIDVIEEDPKELSISLYIEQINSYNMFKTLLLTLPSSVFVSPDNFLPFKAINIFEQNFPNMFSLHNVSTPESLQSFIQLEVINILRKFEKNSQNLQIENIANLLPDFQITNFQKFESSQGLFVNLEVKEIQTGLEESITYFFR